MSHPRRTLLKLFGFLYPSRRVRARCRTTTSSFPDLGRHDTPSGTRNSRRTPNLNWGLHEDSFSEFDGPKSKRQTFHPDFHLCP